MKTYALSGKLSEEDLARGARHLRVVDGINDNTDHPLYGFSILNVGILVDYEKQVHQITACAKIFCNGIVEY